jgi:hypothetical protein
VGVFLIQNTSVLGNLLHDVHNFERCLLVAVIEILVNAECGPFCS